MPPSTPKVPLYWRIAIVIAVIALSFAAGVWLAADPFTHQPPTAPAPVEPTLPYRSVP